MVKVIGRLKHRVTFQTLETTKDAIGQELTTWQNHATVWASIQPLTGKEYFAARQIQSEVSVKVMTRYLSDITSHMRIVEGERIYTILSVVNVDAANRYIEMMCCEKVGD